MRSFHLLLRGLLATMCALSVPAACALGMPDLLFMVFEGHPTVRSQAALVQASYAEVRNAQWQYFPTPSLSLEQVRANSDDTAYNSKDGRVLTLRLQQPLWTWGRLDAGVARARAGVELAQAQAQEARQQLALRTVNAWGEWKSGEQKLLALRESVRTHENLLALIRRRIDTGLSAQADDVLAQGRLEQAQADAALALSQLESAQARLDQLTGRKLSNKFLESLEVPAREPPDSLAAILQTAWKNSPQALRLQTQAQQQSLDIEMRKAQLKPEIYLRAEHQQGSFAAFSLSSASRLFIGMNTTTGPGLAAMSGIDAAYARLDALLAEAESGQRNLEELIEIDYVALRNLHQRRASLSASLRSTQAMVDSWDRQFMAGRKSWIELMNAARELAQAQTAAAEVEAAYIVSSWRLALNTQPNELLEPAGPVIDDASAKP